MTFFEYFTAFCDSTCNKREIQNAKNLLLYSTTDANTITIINDTSDSTIRGYLRRERNIASPLAGQVLDHLDKKKLYKYIRDCTNGDTVKICEIFKAYCPEITEDSAIANMVDLFEQMLSNAFQKKNTPKERAESAITVKDKNEMHSIVTRIQEILDLTINAAVRLRMQKSYGDVESIKRHKAIYHQHYQDFIEQNKKLCYYASVYPKIKVIRKITDLSEVLEFEWFFLRKEHDLYLSPEPRIDEYKGYLDKLLQILHTFG